MYGGIVTAMVSFVIIIGIAAMPSQPAATAINVPNITIVQKNLVLPLKGMAIDPCAASRCQNV